MQNTCKLNTLYDALDQSSTFMASGFHLTWLWQLTENEHLQIPMNLLVAAWSYLTVVTGRWGRSRRQNLDVLFELKKSLSFHHRHRRKLTYTRTTWSSSNCRHCQHCQLLHEKLSAYVGRLRQGVEDGHLAVLCLLCFGPNSGGGGWRDLPVPQGKLCRMHALLNPGISWGISCADSLLSFLAPGLLMLILWNVNQKNRFLEQWGCNIHCISAMSQGLWF